MEFTKRGKERLEPLKSKLFSAEASEPGRYIEDRRDFCLLQLLYVFHLNRIYPAVVLVPAVEHYFADTNISNRIRNRHTLALSMQNINLPELRYDLFEPVASLYQFGPSPNRLLIQERPVA